MTNKYLDYLNKKLSEDPPNFLEIFDYGVEHLPEDPHRDGEDNELGEFFFKLSEMDKVNNDENLRDFVLDAMTYSEGAPASKPNKTDLLNAYKNKIRPNL